MACSLFEIGPHFMVATYAITNLRRYALKQDIKPSDDVEDEETSLTLLTLYSEVSFRWFLRSWSSGFQDTLY